MRKLSLFSPEIHYLYLMLLTNKYFKNSFKWHELLYQALLSTDPRIYSLVSNFFVALREIAAWNQNRVPLYNIPTMDLLL